MNGEDLRLRHARSEIRAAEDTIEYLKYVVECQERLIASWVAEAKVLGARLQEILTPEQLERLITK